MTRPTRRVSTTRSPQTQSTTYRRLLNLRALLPSHTFLQYTATPQAPLLINIIDMLSPNFVEVLEPGAAYTGGHAFFEEHSDLVQVIPTAQVPTAANPLQGAPESLLDALRIFLVGVAAGLMLEGGAGNRSMLVHPSHRTAQHRDFQTWISDVFEEWRGVVRAPAGDPDRVQLLSDFRQSHADLSTTVPDLPAFDDLLPWLSSAFNRTNIVEVNRRERGRAVVIDWGQQYAWILVGGQAMDRGYTVEGLTVTYMPRGIGVGNADTVEQRARFFGYKRRYLGYCRVYLEAGTLAAFQAYVEHEEFMRRQLKAVAERGVPLNDWRRAFVLDPTLKPCRDSVLEFDYVRKLITSDWYSPNYVLADAATYDQNRSVVRELLDGLALQADPGDPRRTAIQRHRYCPDASLRRVVESLITRYRVNDPIDSQHLIGVLVQLAAALDGGRDERCAVYEMSGGATRERRVAEDGRIANLYQGAAPVMPVSERGSIYPGDHAIHDADAVTVQIHNLGLVQNDVSVARDVPVIAIWIPQRLSMPWLIQRQPAQANARDP